jgi:hypothetical protein
LTQSEQTKLTEETKKEFNDFSERILNNVSDIITATLAIKDVEDYSKATLSKLRNRLTMKLLELLPEAKVSSYILELIVLKNKYIELEGLVVSEEKALLKKLEDFKVKKVRKYIEE